MWCNKIQNDEPIRLKAECTLAQSLTEAKYFCQQFDVKECELDFEGFLFDIDQNTDIDKKIKMYKEMFDLSK